MKKINVLLILILLAGTALAAKVITLPDLVRPAGVVVDDNDIVINDGEKIYIYSQKDYKLRRVFGKKGPGPQEFLPSPAPWVPSLRVYLKPKTIFVNAIGKVIIFNRNGDYIKEFKTVGRLNQYIPLENKYVGLGNIVEDNVSYFTYYLYDLTPTREKEILRYKRPDQRGKKLNPVVMGMIKNFLYRQAWQDNVFLPSEDGVIHVFDETGKEVTAVNPPYKPVPFTSEDKKKYDEFFTNDPRFKQIYAQDKSLIQYPDTYPLLKEYRVDGENIYVVTNKMVKGNYETFIFDHQGKLRRKALLPLKNIDLLEICPFTIYKNRLYQLRETEDEEEWELHVIDIK